MAYIYILSAALFILSLKWMISPANTPRRAVEGEFIHFSERMKSAAERI